MAHSIGIYIGKISEMNDDFKFLELEQGIVAILDWPGNRSDEGYDNSRMLEGRTIASINTDYFGGFGEQSATVWKEGQVIFDGSTDEPPIVQNPINQALKLMGVEASTGKDEFDTLGLGNYRSNNDFIEELTNLSDEEENEEEENCFEMVANKIDSEGFDYCFRSYSNFDDIEDEKFHELRRAYKEAAEKLEEYVNSKI